MQFATKYNNDGLPNLFCVIFRLFFWSFSLYSLLNCQSVGLFACWLIKVIAVVIFVNRFCSDFAVLFVLYQLHAMYVFISLEQCVTMSNCWAALMSFNAHYHSAGEYEEEEEDVVSENNNNLINMSWNLLGLRNEVPRSDRLAVVSHRVVALNPLYVHSIMYSIQYTLELWSFFSSLALHRLNFRLELEFIYISTLLSSERMS